MNAHEIKTAINEALTGTAADWWNGASSELVNEMVIYAQRNGLDAAIKEIVDLARVDNADIEAAKRHTGCYGPWNH